MNSIQSIRLGLETSAQMTLGLIDDMKDRPMTFPTPRAGNHPLWVMGHLAWTEGQLQSLMFNKPNPLEKWFPVFGFNSEPTNNPGDYPSMEEARAAFLERRSDTLKFLETLTENDLDRETNCPPEAKKNIGTVGKCLLVLTMNTLTHRGQVADARRAAGRAKMYR